MKKVLIAGALSVYLLTGPLRAEAETHLGPVSFDMGGTDSFSARQIAPGTIEFDAARQGWSFLGKKLAAPPQTISLDIAVRQMPYDQSKISGGGIGFADPANTNDIQFVLINSDGHLRVVHHTPGNMIVEQTAQDSALTPGTNHIVIRPTSADSAQVVINGSTTLGVPLRITQDAGVLVSNVGQGSIIMSHLAFDQPGNLNAVGPAAGPTQGAGLVLPPGASPLIRVPPTQELAAGGNAAGAPAAGNPAMPSPGGVGAFTPPANPAPVAPAPGGVVGAYPPGAGSNGAPSGNAGSPSSGGLPGPPPLWSGAPPAMPTTPAGPINLIGTWRYQSSETLNSGGRLPEQVEIAFTADGRYRQFYQFPGVMELGRQIVQIDGTYQLAGNTLTLMPQQVHVLNGPNPNQLCGLNTGKCITPDLRQTQTQLAQTDPNTIQMPLGTATRVR